MMDKELIERAAREAGFEVGGLPICGESEWDERISVGEYPCGEQLTRFASLIAEEAAKVAESFSLGESIGGPEVIRGGIADAIRAKFTD